MDDQMHRKAFLAKAGAGTVAAASLPALFGAQAALAGASNGHRIYVFVSFSQAPPKGTVLPRIGAQGAGTFDPGAGWVKGGGNYVLFDQNTPGVPKKILAYGEWEPTQFVSYDTKGLGTYGTIQPGILTVKADFAGLGSGLVMELVCNVGAAGLFTGKDEGWTLDTPAYGEFEPLSPVVGITHLSVSGISIDRGA